MVPAERIERPTLGAKNYVSGTLKISGISSNADTKALRCSTGKHKRVKKMTFSPQRPKNLDFT